MKKSDVKSNVIAFLPPLTFNRHFLHRFVNEDPPCAALGIVETAGKQKGFIALRAEKEITNYHAGFDLGTQMLGNNGFAMLHLIFDFGDAQIFDVLLNLGAAATKRVLSVWKLTGDYFFFVFKDGGLTAFHQIIGAAWYDYNYFGVIAKSENSEAQYDRAVQAFRSSKAGHGIHLVLNYQNDTGLLDLKEDRFEVKSSR